ncbi:unnamed protein product [Cuscuta epithymum]|uniref:Histone chaperone domain-containing protein n=1 Tax=Cuscuta epithymum TaxID=186058 RepID=A0AAV0CZ28_9ASTE|nr:unnamed protein product [Cuscuta epithymum]
MAEVRNDQEERALPLKRKPQPDPIVAVATKSLNDDESIKKAKLEKSVAAVASDSDAEDKLIGEGSQRDDSSVNDDEGEEDEEDYDVEEEDDAEDEELSNGVTEIDRKGKGILIEEPVDDSDGESGSSASGSDYSTDGESCPSDDDPLAEIDLENILPSRTRRRTVHPGVRISQQDTGKAEHGSDGGRSSDA